MEQNIKDDPETFAIIGAAMEVHKELGNGFLEKVFQNALEEELTLREIPYEREKIYPVLYKGKPVGEYVADFVCFGGVIVELKALSDLTPTEDSQIINYLKASGNKRGLLLNFGRPSVQWRRRILTS